MIPSAVATLSVSIMCHFLVSCLTRSLSLALGIAMKMTARKTRPTCGAGNLHAVSFIPTAILAKLTGLAALTMLPASAAPVRTLAFDLPASAVSFDVSPADAPADAARPAAHPAKARLEARKNQFGEPQAMAPGSYVASSSAFKSTAQFTLPETPGARFLLLILPKSDGTCAILPIPDASAHIGPGDRFLLNATADEIAVRFGSTRSNLKSGASVVLRPPHPAPQDHRIEVEMVRKVGSEWVPFNSTYWPLDPTARSFVLVHPDPLTGNPRVHNLSEIP